MLSGFTIQRAKHYAPNLFNCLIVCPFWAKSGKYYSKKGGKLMQLLLALPYHLIAVRIQFCSYVTDLLLNALEQKVVTFFLNKNPIREQLDDMKRQ